MMVIPAVIRLKASLSASSASDIKRLTTIMEACLPAEEFYKVTDSSFNVAELKDTLLDWEKVSRYNRDVSSSPIFGLPHPSGVP
jgi:uridine phosphorylase